MAYSDETWAEDDTTPITAARLNRMEDGIQHDGVAGHEDPPVDVAPAADSAWHDVDVSSYVSSFATFAILSVITYNDDVLLRPNGSVNTMYELDNTYTTQIPVTCIVPLDSNGIFEANVGSDNIAEIYLVAWI